ncbi:MAG: Cu(I)-responsive transcriptional regulator [Rhodospirillaceae bacterium]
MNIGEAAEQRGLPAKTIRYYEEIKLVVPARSENGYRAYDGRDVNKLQFVQRARSLGFSVDDCRTLLSLYEDKHRASADVKAIAEDHLTEIEAKITELRTLRDTLKHLVDPCLGDARPECPIIDGLAGRTKGGGK